MTQYVLEGEWGGYTPSQRKICHREVVTEACAKGLKLNTIRFTDGTVLRLSVRLAKPGEKVKTLLGYRELIRDARRYFPDEKYVSVDQVISQQAKRENEQRRIRPRTGDDAEII